MYDLGTVWKCKFCSFSTNITFDVNGFSCDGEQYFKYFCSWNYTFKAEGLRIRYLSMIRKETLYIWSQDWSCTRKQNSKPLKSFSSKNTDSRLRYFLFSLCFQLSIIHLSVHFHSLDHHIYVAVEFQPISSLIKHINR